MNGYTTKNYTAQGGALTVIGGELQILGKLTVDPGAEVNGLFSGDAQIMEAVEFVGIEDQQDSEATTVAALREDFNALLCKMRAAGMFADDAPRIDVGIAP